MFVPQLQTYDSRTFALAHLQNLHSVTSCACIVGTNSLHPVINTSEHVTTSANNNNLSLFPACSSNSSSNCYAGLHCPDLYSGPDCIAPMATPRAKITHIHSGSELFDWDALDDANSDHESEVPLDTIGEGDEEADFGTEAGSPLHAAMSPTSDGQPAGEHTAGGTPGPRSETPEPCGDVPTPLSFQAVTTPRDLPNTTGSTAAVATVATD